MNRIRVLSDTLANQIAAGEVVERPASVVKELIENAIDAGSKRIIVDIELGGRRMIRIVDDGHGMMRDDAILSFERHATSKIRTLDDLAAIGTLGFRGEALASIASVAKVEMTTKAEPAAAATKIVIEGGRLVDVADAARDTGTTIAVRELFFNTPARRKFMRSEATENYHLTTIVTHYALAHPEIAFTLTNNGREVIRTPAVKDLRERAFQLFGGNVFESLLPVNGGRETVAAVSGFVSAPRERRTSRDSQYFFVNNRFVRDKTIAAGLMEGYRSVLPHGVYPVAFLFLNVPADEIDVNVHPAKTEIRFRRTEAVKDVIADAVRSALARAGITVAEPVSQPVVTETAEISPAIPHAVATPASETGPEQTKIDFFNAVSERVNNEPPPFQLETVEVQAEIAPPFYAEIDTSSEFEHLAELRHVSAEPVFAASESPVPELPPVDSAARFIKPAETEDVDQAKIKPLGQLHESFIIAVDDEGLLLVDQHVAHERILFDKFRRSEAERPIESQNLLLPETIDLTPAQAEAFRAIEPELGSLGFNIMQLSGRTIAIRSIPTDLPAAEARNLFAEMLDTVELDKRGGAKSTFRDNIAASLACKAAVKINMPLTPEKMRWLIDRLLLTSSPTTCPHGRPVILRLTMKDIERGFHRT